MPARKKITSRRPKRVSARVPVSTAVPASAHTATTTRTFTITNTALAIALACLGTASIAAAGMGTISPCATEPSQKVVFAGVSTLCKKQTIILNASSPKSMPTFQATGFNGSALTLISNGTPAKKYINKNQTVEFTFADGAATVTYLGLDDQSRAVIKIMTVTTMAPEATAAIVTATATVTAPLAPTSTYEAAPSSTFPISGTAAGSTGTPAVQPVAPLVSTGPITKNCVDPDKSFEPHLNYYQGKAPVDVLNTDSLKVKSAIQIKMNPYNSSKVNIFTDNCSPDDLTVVNEALCIDQQKVGMFSFNCPSGTMCNDGACK